MYHMQNTDHIEFRTGLLKSSPLASTVNRKQTPTVRVLEATRRLTAGLSFSAAFSFHDRHETTPPAQKELALEGESPQHHKGASRRCELTVPITAQPP